MLLPETGLEGFEQGVGIEMGLKLGSDGEFKQFGQKGKVGYGSEV